MRHLWPSVVIVASLLGIFFAAFATYDFVQHLDRQVHGIHCSFIPGIEQTDVSGATGCHVTLMSPYSSVFRDSMWGGIPVSLPAISVFCFLLFFVVTILVQDRRSDPAATGFLALATLVPVGASLVMGYLSFAELDAACKLCIGIYTASALSFAGAVGMWLQARNATEAGPPPLRMPILAGMFGLGVLFVAVPVAAYAGSAPDFKAYIGSCGALVDYESEDEVLVPLGPQGLGVEVVEVLDPLCPACRAFEHRFDAQGAVSRVKRRALLFPLDNTCNWMVDSAIHPGACTISEAVLCAGDGAEEVLDWAFAEQDKIRAAAAEDPEAAARFVRDRFPSLSKCVGTPEAQAKLNLALRFAVKNQMPVLTPQVYVNGVRMCDEDTDLGMDWALARLIDLAETRGPVDKGAPAVATGDGAPRVAEGPSRGAAAAPQKAIVLRPGTEPAPPKNGETPTEAKPAAATADGGVATGAAESAPTGEEGTAEEPAATPAQQGEQEAAPTGAEPAATPAEAETNTEAPKAAPPDKPAVPPGQAKKEQKEEEAP